jgi:Flp pilus assembly pilin Flp
MKQLLSNFIKDESGQDLVEYALLLGVLAAAGVATLATIGGFISTDLLAAKTSLAGS